MTITPPQISKKMVFALAVVVCATWLAHDGIIEPDKWVGLVERIGAIYIIAQGAIDVIRPKPKEPDGVQPG